MLMDQKWQRSRLASEVAVTSLVTVLFFLFTLFSAALLGGCAGRTQDVNELAGVAKRVDALELKVGNVQDTLFNGGQVSLLAIQPAFAETMRRYADRFADMFFAAKNGNWALAAYMDRRMREAVASLRVTRPRDWSAVNSFHRTSLDPLLAATAKMDFAAFQSQYAKTIVTCNSCHAAMGFSYVMFVQPTQPAQPNLNYTAKTKATDFKEFLPPGTP